MRSAAGFQIIGADSAEPARRARELLIDVAVVTHADRFALDHERESRGLRGAPGALVLRSESGALRAIASGGVPGLGERRHRGQRGLQPLAGAPKRHRLFLYDLAHDARVALSRPVFHRHPTATAVTSHCWR